MTNSNSGLFKNTDNKYYHLTEIVAENYYVR